MRSPCLLFLAALGLFLLPGGASADLTFQFSDTSNVFTNSFNINSVGGTVDVKVYLFATDGGLGNDRTLLKGVPAMMPEAGGLFRGGVKLDYTASGGTVQVVTPTDVTKNPVFPNYVQRTATSSVAVLKESLNTGEGTTVGVTLDANNRIFLGTFRFTGFNESVTTVTATTPDMNTTATPQNVILDSHFVPPAPTFTITSVPEPASMALSGLAAAGLAGGAWRRWRQKRARAKAATTDLA